MRAHVAEDCKNDYAAQLQKYNKEQNQLYFNDMPLIFNVSKLPIAACITFMPSTFEFLTSGIVVTLEFAKYSHTKFFDWTERPK